MKRTKIYYISILVLTIMNYGCLSGQKSEIVKLSESKILIGEDTLLKVNDTLYQKFFPSGKVEYEGKIDNNKKQGRWVSYYEDGTICRINNYTDGLRNGKFIWYFTNGNKQRELDLVNDVWHGEDKYWNKDGTLNSITKYVNGERIEIRVFKPNYVNSNDSTEHDGKVIWKKE